MRNQHAPEVELEKYSQLDITSRTDRTLDDDLQLSKKTSTDSIFEKSMEPKIMLFDNVME